MFLTDCVWRQSMTVSSMRLCWRVKSCRQSNCTIHYHQVNWAVVFNHIFVWILSTTSCNKSYWTTCVHINYSKTCFEGPLKFTRENGRKWQVVLQRRGERNVKAKFFKNTWFWKVVLQARSPPKGVTANDRFYCISLKMVCCEFSDIYNYFCANWSTDICRGFIILAHTML